MATVASDETKPLRKRHELACGGARAVVVLALVIAVALLWALWRVRACLPHLDGVIQGEGPGSAS